MTIDYIAHPPVHPPTAIEFMLDYLAGRPTGAFDETHQIVGFTLGATANIEGIYESGRVGVVDVKMHLSPMIDVVQHRGLDTVECTDAMNLVVRADPAMTAIWAQMLTSDWEVAKAIYAMTATYRYLATGLGHHQITTDVRKRLQLYTAWLSDVEIPSPPVDADD